jgi:Cu+-exporting ATPase
MPSMAVTLSFLQRRLPAKFIADPERYLGPPAPPVAAPAGTIWTCPMHPEIRQDHPGSCPICGMALEPRP